jgi:hypothetical protein
MDTESARAALVGLGVGDPGLSQGVRVFTAVPDTDTAALIEHVKTDAEAPRALGEALAHYPPSAEGSIDVVRFLMAAAGEGRNGDGVRSLLERIAGSSEKNDLVRLARYVGESARTAIHPDTVFARVAEWVIDPKLQLMSDEALAGLAGLVAAECRQTHQREDAAARVTAERAQHALRETPSWRALVEGRDRHGDIFVSIIPALQPEDIADLVATFSVELPDAERRVCIGIVGKLIDSKDLRLGSAHRTELAQALAVRLVGNTRIGAPEYDLRLLWVKVDPAAVLAEILKTYDESGWLDRELKDALLRACRQTPDASVAILELCRRVVPRELARGQGPFELLRYWAVLDSASMAAYLTQEVHLDGLSDMGRRSVAAGLLSVGGDAAVAALRRIQAQGGPAAADALVALEILGGAPPDRIDALAKAWREDRSSENLSKLYYAYIERLPMGAPFEPWLERLGHTDRRERSFWISPDAGKGGPALFLELDRELRLQGISFK